MLTESARPILASGKAKPRIKCGATILGAKIREHAGRLIGEHWSLKAAIYLLHCSGDLRTKGKHSYHKIHRSDWSSTVVNLIWSVSRSPDASPEFFHNNNGACARFRTHNRGYRAA